MNNDANKRNNSPENLEAISHIENVRHAISLGLCVVSGSGAPNSKLTAEQVREIRRLYVPGTMGCIRLGKQFGVSNSAIWMIVNGVTYQDVI